MNCISSNVTLCNTYTDVFRDVTIIRFTPRSEHQSATPPRIYTGQQTLHGEHKVERNPKLQETIESGRVGSSWKMRPLNQTLLTRSAAFQLCWTRYGHTKCPGEHKTIHKRGNSTVPRSAWKRHKPWSSFYRRGQRQMLYCTSPSLQPSHTPTSGGAQEPCQLIPEACGWGQERAAYSWVGGVSLETGSCLTISCRHKILFTSTSHRPTRWQGRRQGEKHVARVFRSWEGRQKRGQNLS